jgi:hypothetical protein
MTNTSIVRLRRITVLLATASLVGGCSGAITSDGVRADAVRAATSDRVPADDARPASVPPEFVRTGRGFMHPSCVFAVAAGERYEQPGAIVGSDGTRREVAPCAYERYDLHGQLVSPRKVMPADIVPFGTVAQASMDATGVTWFSADWIVPSPSTDANSSVPRFFDAMVNSEEILYPSLLGGYRPWLVDVEFVAANGNVFYAGDTPVNPGDRITGFMYPNGNGLWTGAININGSPALGLTISPAAPFTELIGGAFESPIYNTCGFYPSSGGITFNNFGLIDNGQWTAPTWHVTTQSQPPNCLTGVSANASAISMTWDSSDPPPPKCTLVPKVCCTRPSLPVCNE